MFLKIYPPDAPPFAVTLREGEFLIGTAATNQVVINDPSLSRKHLKVIVDKNEFFVLDQGSTNGTFRDKEQLVPGTRAKLVEEEFIRLGNATFILLVEEADTEIDPPPPVEAPKEQLHEKTRVIKLKEIMPPPRSKTKAGAKVAGTAKLKDPQRESFYKSIMLALLMVIMGYFVNRAFQTERPELTNKVIQGLKVDRTQLTGEGAKLPE